MFGETTTWKGRSSLEHFYSFSYFYTFSSAVTVITMRFEDTNIQEDIYIRLLDTYHTTVVQIHRRARADTHSPTD